MAFFGNLPVDHLSEPENEYAKAWVPGGPRYGEAPNHYVQEVDSDFFLVLTPEGLKTAGGQEKYPKGRRVWEVWRFFHTPARTRTGFHLPQGGARKLGEVRDYDAERKLWLAENKHERIFLDQVDRRVTEWCLEWLNVPLEKRMRVRAQLDKQAKHNAEQRALSDYDERCVQSVRNYDQAAPDFSVAVDGFKDEAPKVAPKPRGRPRKTVTPDSAE